MGMSKASSQQEATTTGNIVSYSLVNFNGSYTVPLDTAVAQQPASGRFCSVSGSAAKLPAIDWHACSTFVQLPNVTTTTKCSPWVPLPRTGALPIPSDIPIV